MRKSLFLLLAVAAFSTAPCLGVEVPVFEGVQGRNATILCPSSDSAATVASVHWYRQRDNKAVYFNVGGTVINSDKYFAEGSHLIITKLDRVEDEGDYLCSVTTTNPPASYTTASRLVVYQPPDGIELFASSAETPIFYCRTEGGSKPPVDIKFGWMDRHNQTKKVDGNIEVKHTVLDYQSGFQETEAKWRMERFGMENRFDTITCTATNARTDTVFTQAVQLTPPSLKYGTPKNFLEQQIPTIQFTQQAPAELEEPGMVWMKIADYKDLFYINETVSFSIQHKSPNFFPSLSYRWFVKTEEDKYARELVETASSLEYLADENATVSCLVSNILGKALIYASINVKPGSSYNELQKGSEVNESSAWLLAVIIGVVAAVIIIVVSAMFIKRRRAQKHMDEKYDVKRSTEAHMMRAAATGGNGQTNVPVEDEGEGADPSTPVMLSYSKVDEEAKRDDERLLKSSNDDFHRRHDDNDDDDDGFDSDVTSERKYDLPPPSQSSSASSSFGDKTPGAVTGSSSLYRGGGDDVSMKSGSTICIDDETFPLHQEEEDDDQEAGDYPRRHHHHNHHHDDGVEYVVDDDDEDRNVVV